MRSITVHSRELMEFCYNTRLRHFKGRVRFSSAVEASIESLDESGHAPSFSEHREDCDRVIRSDFEHRAVSEAAPGGGGSVKVAVAGAQNRSVRIAQSQIEQLRNYRERALQRNPENRSRVVRGRHAAEGRCPVKVSIRRLHERADWAATLGMGVAADDNGKDVKNGKDSGRCDSENSTAAVAALESRAIEVTIGRLHQRRIRIGGIATVAREIVQDLYGASRMLKK